MIPLSKLAKLSPKHRMRKTALVLGEVERQLLTSKEDIDYSELSRWARELSTLFADEAPEPVRSAAEALRLAAGEEERAAGDSAAGSARSAPESAASGDSAEKCAAERFTRAVDALRHALLHATGQAPADWDLIDPRSGMPDAGTRRIVPGLCAYLDDLRSPFNVGSIFRTADAFGLEEILLSPSCADPLHPRSQRSAMGAVELVRWRRESLVRISKEIPVFALELGGEDLGSFVFPSNGIVVLGSEELGISREIRELCTYGTVSIPMSGAKGSLNVAVAFGVLMYAWTSSIRSREADGPHLV